MMDDSPMAQLLRHADAVEAARLAVVKVADGQAATAEEHRPGKQAAREHQADGQQG